MHQFRHAVEAGDLDAAIALLDDGVIFRSPIAHKPYVGKEVVGLILRTVATIFEDFVYEREIGAPGSPDHALVFAATVDGLQIQGCDFLRTNDAGLIEEFTVMLRPLKAVQAFAGKMGAAFQAAMAAGVEDGTS
ncbi:MAG: nuclear transport factor 2 family protein [Mycobacterium sp.]|nr:nuclear transport factor 2 family protein [Mycobacterium sp.]